jgi:hypothetical protein
MSGTQPPDIPAARIKLMATAISDIGVGLVLSRRSSAATCR